MLQFLRVLRTYKKDRSISVENTMSGKTSIALEDKSL